MRNTRPAPAPPDRIDEADRVAAIDRLTDVYSEGRVSFEHFSAVLDELFAAHDRAGLEVAMVTLPPLVRFTPGRLRRAGPLVLRVADHRLDLGRGWQLAADTTVATGFGLARLDLTAATWDAGQIDLHLETWGSIEVLVPEGVAVQRRSGSRPVQLDSVAPPVPGGPVVRISTNGPSGVIRVRHPDERDTATVGWRRWRNPVDRPGAVGRSSRPRGRGHR